MRAEAMKSGLIGARNALAKEGGALLVEHHCNS